MTIQNVNQGVNSAVNLGSKPAEKKSVESANQENKGMSKTAKVLIGAAALSAAVLGGIVAHKNIAAGKALKDKISSLEGKISSIEHYSQEPLTKRMEEISKLKGKDKLDALEGLKSTIEKANDVHSSIKNDTYFDKGLKELPEDVKAAYESKDALKTIELYNAHLAKLPDTYVPINRGATVAETIENTFGKNSSIKPHTYDLSQENQQFALYYDCDGMRDATVTKKGIYYTTYGERDLDLLEAVCHSSNSEKCKEHGFNIISGSVSELSGSNKNNFTNPDRKLVKFIFNSDANDPTRTSSILVISPNNNFTPFQRDLLKLAEHPERYDESVINKITDPLAYDPLKPKEAKERLLHKQYLPNCDYDLLLSAFQSMVK